MSTHPADPGPGEQGDEGTLAKIKALFEAVDPAPADLAERVRFAVALADLEAEAARLVDEAAVQPALTRGAPEESRTITFDSTELTIMIRIDANADGTARVDGWLAPPGARRVEVSFDDGALAVAADTDGRFAFPSVPRGTVRFVVRPPAQQAHAVPDSSGPDSSGPDSSGNARMKTVITPALVLLRTR
jgi:hypothetical protein